MAYSIDPTDYREEELYAVAELHFVQRLSHQAVADRLHLRPRAKVQAMCEAARRVGLVQIAVRPSRAVEGGRLRDLAARVREKFRLLDCVVVHGRSEMLNSPLPDNVREVIMDDIAREASRQLDRRFFEANGPCLAVTYGYVTRKVADYLRPRQVQREGLVLAAQGVRRLEVDRFDANNIVRDVARQFGCKYACMPIPALVDARDMKIVRHLPLVEALMDALDHRTNMVIGSLASHHQTDWTPRQDSLQNDLLDPDDRLRYMNSIIEQGGVGNIGGWWFDTVGNAVEAKERSVVGLGLGRIKEVVADGNPVMLAVGADATRIPALAIALSAKKPLCSIWVGDEVTARVLLGEHRIQLEAFNFRENELQVLERLGDK